MDAWERRFSQSLIDAIETRIADLKDKLVTTRAVDFADYKERVGAIMGLNAALIDARALVRAMEQPEQREPPDIAARRMNYES